MAAYIPSELLELILVHLPVRSLLRFSCVCRHWHDLIRNNLITNPDFIHAHLQNRLNSVEKLFFFLPYEKPEEQLPLTWNLMRHQPSLRFDNQELEVYMPLDDPPFLPIETFEIVGSCNGLVCLFKGFADVWNSGYRVLIWNPLLRQSFEPPLPAGIIADPTSNSFICRHFLGFGYNSERKDYQVLWTVCTCRDSFQTSRTHLYSLNSRSWSNINNIDTPNDRLLHIHRFFGNTIKPSVYVNGKLHWILDVVEGNLGNRVAVYDFTAGVFGMIELPDPLVHIHESELTVIAYKASIAVSHQVLGTNVYSIWVMREYDSPLSWVDLGIFGNSYKRASKALLFRNDANTVIQAADVEIRVPHAIIQFYSGLLTPQNPRNKHLQRFSRFPPKVRANMCNFVDSLVPLPALRRPFRGC